MKQIFAALLLLLLATFASSQTLTPTWTVPYTGTSGFKVRTGPDGSVYTVSAGAPPYQVAVDKYTPAGVHSWHQTYMHMPWTMTPVDLAIDSTGAAIVVTNDAGPSSRITTEKITSAGAIAWSADLLPPSGKSYTPFAGKVGSSDNIYIGILQPGAGSAGSGVIVLATYPSTGGTAAVQTWSNIPTEDFPIGLAVNGTSAYFAVDSLIPSTSTGCVYVVNFAYGGSSAVWANYWELSGYADLASGIVADSTGAYVTGEDEILPMYTDNLQMFAFKFNTSGGLVWQQSGLQPFCWTQIMTGRFL